ncbi:MAG: hypothetical protein D6731_26205 [Planctomycetota bacterium]|nr:MAG: hypothetical protein D6731_26205 [Planctomycetota bacterium]
MARKRGLRAMALKAGYKTVKGLRPGFVPAVVDFLLDEFCAALDPFYRRWSEGPADARPPLARALEAERDAVAEALLGVTDRRADRSTNRVVVKIYRKLRPTAKEHVLEALPGLGRSIEPFLRSSV